MRSLAVITVCLVALTASAQPAEPRNAPIPPPATSATDLWRRVLAMSERERDAFINSKPPAAQVYLKDKVREYLALAPAEREARLVALELRATMLPLMKMSPTNRSRQLQMLPDTKRREIQQRLLTWDILPPPLQKDVLENETVVRLFVQMRESGASRDQVLAGMSPQNREEMQKKLADWDNMPTERRDQIFGSVQRFFDLDEKTRSRTLAALSDGEREKVMPTLAALDRMPKEQRERALEGFKRFTQLSAKAQQDFLRTARRWEAMQEKDKQLWRDIVATLRNAPAQPPPFPPAPGTLRNTRVSAGSN